MNATNWRPVYGYEGVYEVSECGDVRRIRTGRILRPMTDRKGYRYHRLSSNGESTRQKEHRIVAAAFYGFFPGLLVRHLDDNPANNQVENLAWGTAQDNTNDRIAHGRKTGLNHLKTHCIHGHEFTPENTKLARHTVDGKIHRSCRECHRTYQREKRRREAA